MEGFRTKSCMLALQIEKEQYLAGELATTMHGAVPVYMQSPRNDVFNPLGAPPKKCLKIIYTASAQIFKTPAWYAGADALTFPSE